MSGLDYGLILKFLAAESALVVTALLVLFLDLGPLRRAGNERRFASAAWLCSAGLVAGFVLLFVEPVSNSLQAGILVLDPLARLAKQGVLILSLFTVWIARGARFTDHAGEFFSLLLFASVGMMLMVGSENLLMIFLALEFASLSLYILAAFDKRSPNAAEAALKYFLFGGVAAAFTLFGISLLYGLAATLDLRQIAPALARGGLNPLLLMALVMVMAGLGFKIAAAPFHFWAPDAYQGAPTPAAALIASGSKMAAFILLAKVVMTGFAGFEGSASLDGPVSGWIPLLALLAALSMVLGNLAAIAQTNVKRLLGYSAIAHAGYALLGVMANGPDGISAMVYYVFTYALATLGAFGVIQCVEQGRGDSQISSFAGLGRRSPWTAFCMLLFVLSLAGIPPLPGFFGKLYLFIAAIKSGAGGFALLWLVALAMAASVISFYYYLQILKQMYLRPGQPEAEDVTDLCGGKAAITVLAIGTLAFGVLPEPTISLLLRAVIP